jgi:hypothetical protein
MSKEFKLGDRVKVYATMGKTPYLEQAIIDIDEILGGKR